MGITKYAIKTEKKKRDENRNKEEGQQIRAIIIATISKVTLNINGLTVTIKKQQLSR